MRLRVVAICVAALAFPLVAGAAPAFRATFTASTHTPKVNAKWLYAVRVTNLAGKADPGDDHVLTYWIKSR